MNEPAHEAMTPLEAMDAIEDAKTTIEGLSAISLALSVADMGEKPALSVISNTLEQTATKLSCANKALRQRPISCVRHSRTPSSVDYATIVM